MNDGQKNGNNPCSRIFLLLFFCACTASVSAQTMSDTLQEQQVKGRKHRVSDDDKINRFSPGQKVVSIDSVTKSLYEQQNVAQLLARQVPVFVKSYGFNALSTLNFRGSSAAQSQVYWNGVPLQNAALGIADVSLLPVSFSDKINVVYGSSAALWGSGNVGGALLLENDRPAFAEQDEYHLTASLGAGSFAQYNALLKAVYSGKRLSATIRGLYQSALNNFSYPTDSGRQRMPHSKLSGAGILGNLGWKISEKQVLSLSLWGQQYDRQVPPALFESYSVKQQTDGALRALLDWQLQQKQSAWYAKAAFLYDRMHYQDSASDLNTNNRTYQYFQELGWQYERGANHLQLFVPLQLAWFRTEADELKQQTQVALAAAYSRELFRSRLKLVLSLRDQQTDSRNEWLPGINAGWQLTDWLQLRGNVQRTFRVPTLNELYYDPGGNPDLKPETGWSEELGYALKLSRGPWQLQHDAAFFNRSIHDWIIWYGGAIWTPHNIATVHSRGIETENRLRWQQGNWQWHLGLNTSYLLATTVASYSPNDGSIGKQIPYTPHYQWQCSLGLGFRHWYFSYDHSYTGYRFVTSDESQYLDPYQSGNAALQYAGSLRQRSFRVLVQCNNMWNTQYEVVAGRPLPGRYWQLACSVQLL